MPGERVLVAGESGTGKSTLVRAISGLWPWREGIVQVASGAKMFLMPQRAYVPVGTLRRAATYPEPADSKGIEEVAEALKRVGLSTSSIVLRRRPHGIRRSLEARSRGSPLPASCCIGRTSSCSTRRPLRSIPTARTN